MKLRRTRNGLAHTCNSPAASQRGSPWTRPGRGLSGAKILSLFHDLLHHTASKSGLTCRRKDRIRAADIDNQAVSRRGLLEATDRGRSVLFFTNLPKWANS